MPTRSFNRSLKHRGPSTVALVLLYLYPALQADDFQGSSHLVPFEEESIGYTKTEAIGPIARLQRKIDQSQISLTYDETGQGYLVSLMNALNISPESQLLVFSKSSFQRERISPQTPRAVYFNDDVYIGFIPGSSMLEISEADPQLGGVFYTLEQRPNDKPKFVRTDQCLECHASSRSMGVPGHLVRSFQTDERGIVDLITGISPITHRTPYADRRGGWYVTGTHGNQPHRGNLIGKADFDRQKVDSNYRANLTDLSAFFQSRPYLRETSDIVALMVIEHQAHMHNFITRLNYETRMMISAYGHTRYLRKKVDAFLRYLLFAEEAPLNEPVHGPSRFTDSFSALGPTDSKGRSLREFDLETRLFKYPCSFLIYSEPFDALPAPIKVQIYDRLWNILTGNDQSEDFKRLTVADRQAILEILIETKPGLPSHWKTAN